MKALSKIAPRAEIDVITYLHGNELLIDTHYKHTPDVKEIWFFGSNGGFKRKLLRKRKVE